VHDDLLVDVTPGSGPAYTLLAFVIVIVGGLGDERALIGGVLMEFRSVRRLLLHIAKSMISFALMIIVLIFRPRGLDRRQIVKRRAILLVVGVFGLLLTLPLWASPYTVSLATLFLFFAYAGQAWNIMMGFAGLLSLGHALYPRGRRLYGGSSL
jgi:ABC-type branched-subunit amino acid transport system permease subunit